MGTPQSGRFFDFWSEGPQGARFRTQGPPNQKKVGPEPARLDKWKQKLSKSVPKSNALKVAPGAPNPFKNLSSAFYNVQKGSAALERIEHLLEAENAITEKENPVTVNSFNDNWSGFYFILYF